MREKTILSDKLKYYLDNPRTETDIALVRDYWQTAYDAIENKRAVPLHSDNALFALETHLFFFRDTFSAKDEYVAEVFKTYSREGFFDFLARMTILAFFINEAEAKEPNVEIRRPKKSSNAGTSSMAFTEVDLDKSLINYCQLLSLLVHSEQDGYNGLSFVIDNESPGYPRIGPPRISVWMVYFAFGAFCATLEGDIPEGDDTVSGERLWMVWPSVRHRLMEQARNLELAFADGLTEKLLVVGNMLEMAKHSQDEKLRLVMLTSIIELLLTHNPAFDRFNVEDSINKQFQLKVAILVYLNDKRRGIASIGKRLKTIYQQRSNIVHGNFGEVEKYVRALSRKNGHEEYFGDLVTDLYVYVRAILEEYLKDSKFVEFLKEG